MRSPPRVTRDSIRFIRLLKEVFWKKTRFRFLCSFWILGDRQEEMGSSVYHAWISTLYECCIRSQTTLLQVSETIGCNALWTLCSARSIVSNGVSPPTIFYLTLLLFLPPAIFLGSSLQEAIFARIYSQRSNSDC